MSNPQSKDGAAKGRPMRGVVLVVGTFVALVLWVFYAGDEADPTAAEKTRYMANGPALTERTEAEYEQRYQEAASKHEAGARIFKRRCSTCHRDDGGGLEGLGANLTDTCFIHGNAISDHVRIVWKGVPGTTMRGFSRLGQDKVEQVALYVRSLHGTNVADGLACRGTRTP